MSAGRQKPIRGRARRATCPKCGRKIAVSHDWLAYDYVLRPHNAAPGTPCKGWRVDRAALLSLDQTTTEGDS